MSEVSVTDPIVAATPVATSEAPTTAAPKKVLALVKKAAPAKAPTKAKEKAAPKKAPIQTEKPAKKAPAASNGKEKKGGLRKPQERILKFLAKFPDKSFTRAQISEKAEVDVAACVEYLGSHNEEKRVANDVKHFMSLVSLKLVKFGPAQEEGASVSYAVSATGKAAAAKLTD